MEFKGITWAYQKFEAMCLEAEEAILEDTAKYIKKFYSDVMEDLLPPVASGDADIDKKSEPNKEALMIGYYDVHSLVPQSPGISVENKCSEPCGTVGKKVGAHRRSIGIKRLSKNERPSKDSSGMTSSSSGDRRSKLASSDTISSRVASDNIKGTASIPETPIESHASDKILSAESVRPNKDDSEFERPNKDDSESVRRNIDDCESVRPNEDASNCTSLASDDNLSAESVGLKEDPESNSPSPTKPHGTSKNDVSFSLPGSSARSNACNLESENKVMVSNEGTSMEVGSSNVRTTFNAAESLDKKIIMPNEDMLEMEVIKKDEVGVAKRVNIGMEKLEESCVMVDKTELHSVPQETMKHKSYKKRIQEALWLKSRSRRDNEEREVVIPVKVGAADSYESDWELL